MLFVYTLQEFSCKFTRNISTIDMIRVRNPMTNQMYFIEMSTQNTLMGAHLIQKHNGVCSKCVTKRMQFAERSKKSHGGC